MTTPTLDDLRTALREAAAETHTPDAAVTLDEVGQIITAARRRWRTGIAAVAAAAAVVGSGVLGWTQARDERPSPAASTVVDDPHFPEYERGLKRISVIDLPLAPDTKAVVTTRERAQSRLYVSAYCEGGGGVTPLLSVTSASRQEYLPCLSGAEVRLASGRSMLWRPADAGFELLFEPTRTARGTGHARVAVYQEVEWEEYRFPPRPHDLESSPDTAWVAAPDAQIHEGPKDAARPNEPLTVTVRPEKYLLVRLVARAPGELRLTLNGQFLSLHCSDPLAPAVCGSTSSHTITQWGYGRAQADKWFDVDTRASWIRPGQDTTITVYPSRFAGDDWRLEVFTSES